MSLAVIILGLIAAFAYTTYGVFFKLAQNKIEAYLFLGIINLVAFMCYMGLYYWQRHEAVHDKIALTPTHLTAVGMAIIGGMSVPFLEVAVFRMIKMGTPFSITFPAVLATALAMMAIIGVVFMKDTISVYNGIGIILAIIAVLLLAH